MPLLIGSTYQRGMQSSAERRSKIKLALQPSPHDEVCPPAPHSIFRLHTQKRHKLANRTTPLRLESNSLPMLCALCLSIFTRRLRTFTWPDDLSHIRKGSEAGCKICSGLMDRASTLPAGLPDRIQGLPARLVPKGINFCCGFDPKAPDCFEMGIGNRYCAMGGFYLVRNESVQIPEGYPEYLHHASLDLMSEPWRVRPDGFEKSIPRNTGDSGVTKIALGWLNSCLGSHKACPQHQHPSTYPKRLIEVGGPRPCLIVADDKPLNGHYATLSHCWGENPKFLTLTQSSLDSFKHRLPLDELPQTFQDAITLVHRLKIPYLWIDSLCIIQGNDQDWLEHAQTMASIYEGCVLNISVDHASSPSVGIFKERDTDRVQDCRVLWAPPSEERETVWTILDTENDLFNHHQLPLHTRGWVFQERLLSPRILHFGKNAMFWECKTSPCSSEASPTVSGSWSPVETLFSIAPDPPTQSTETSIAEYHCKLKERFHGLIVQYSKLKLTKPDNDKLVAFAGIAKRVGSIDYYSDQYFAGFFKRDLPVDLVWLKTGFQVTKKNQEIYRAPTWSWASLDSSIATFPWHQRAMMTDFVTLVEVRPISVNYIDRGNRYGQIKSAQLALLGGLIPCRIGTIIVERNAFLSANLQDAAEPSNTIGEFRPDMREGASYEVLKFACPIVECRWRECYGGRQIRGIILQTTENGMFYERLGSFSTSFWYSWEVEQLHHMTSLQKKQSITIV